MRAFIALDLGDPLRAALADLAGEARAGRAVPEENLHLTLAFLGEIDDAQAQAMHEALTGLGLPEVALNLAGLEIWGQAGVAVIRAEADPGLLRLEKAVSKAARLAQIPLDRRRFRPHVTLLRLGRADPERLAPWLMARGAVRLPEAHPEGIVFVRSQLHPDGARHEILADYPLGAT